MQNRPTVTRLELEAYADGELPQADAERVERALEKDTTLRAQFNAISRERVRIEGAVKPNNDDRSDPMAELLARKLQAKLDAHAQTKRVRRTAAIAVAGLAVAAVGWVGHDYATAPAPGADGSAAGAPPRFVADAAGAHSVFAFDEVHPVEFASSDQAIMQDWFASHLGQSALVPDLGELGFALLGGRLLGDADGAMAQILYENAAGDRVSLVFGKRMVAGGSELKLVKIGKHYASYWRNGDMAWAVVEDTPGADVSAVATHVARLVD